jgi:probable F420-dependent oxidoreductase
MKVGLVPASGGSFPVDGSLVAALARAAEAAGFDSIWVGEHVVMAASPAQEYPGARQNRIGPSTLGALPDPIEWLSYAAAVTERVLLGTAILLLPLHNPLIMAKRIATLDQLSGGRVRLGIGLGWSEDEYEAVGESFRTRGRRCDEQVAAMRALWRDSPASFDGEIIRFGPVHSAPQPVRGAVPVLVGGDSDAAARRAGRIGDGYLPSEKDPDRLAELIATMRRSAEDAGRDPDGIELTCLGSRRPEAVARLAEIGFARMLLFLPELNPAAVERLGGQVRDLIAGL